MPLVLIGSHRSAASASPAGPMLADAGFEVRVIKDEEFVRGAKSDREAVEILRGAAAVVAMGENYTAEVIHSLPDLRVIARHGVGYDKVDVSAATEAGVVLTITPTANHEAVAEHALALLLAVSKSLVPGDRMLRSGGWSAPPRASLRQSTLGIVGLGRIGRSLATRAKAMGMKLIATEIAPDRDFVAENDVRLVDLDTLLATADYVSLHCALSEDTRGMIDAKKLGRMKPDAVLVNTARGGLVVEADLVEALRSGTIGGAGLDVFEAEPTNPKNPLYEFDNVVVSPHVAGNDFLGLENMAIEAAQCIIDLSRGVWPEPAVINRELKGRWRW